MNVRYLDEFEASLSSEESLISMVDKFRAKGFTQLDIYLLFEDYLEYLRGNNRDDDPETDNLYDVLARIYGWCGPQAKLFEECLSNKQIEAKRIK